jgi:hypothetical protein
MGIMGREVEALILIGVSQWPAGVTRMRDI